MTIANESKDLESYGAHALSLVNEKLAGRRMECQLCGQNEWDLRGDLSVVATWDIDAGDFPGFALATQALPLVTLLCKNCGHMLFISALALGLGDLIESNRKRGKRD